MNNEFRRIFCDSRFRTNLADTNSDFSLQLPWSVSIPAGSQLFVDNITLSHSWPTITQKNNKLYLQEIDGAGAKYHRMISLTPGQYNIATLAVEIQTQMRAGTFLANGLYNVTFVSGRLIISTTAPTGQAYLFGRRELNNEISFGINWNFPGIGLVEFSSVFDTIWEAADAVSPPIPPNPREDACELIGLMQTGVAISSGTPATLAHVDMQRYKCLYLCSSDLGDSTSMNIRGNTDIIRKIVVGNSVQGDIIVDTMQTPTAFALFRTDTTLSYLKFQLRDYRGNT